MFKFRSDKENQERRDGLERRRRTYEARVQAAKEEMGEMYLYHPNNRVQRKVKTK